MNQFLSNQTDPTMLNALKDSLEVCDSFAFSVSFIKYAGLNLLKKDIEGALKRGAKGYFITSTYQNFTDIASLECLYQWTIEYPNFNAYLDYQSKYEGGFHVKAYLFKSNENQWTIIGSTNLTLYALIKNHEWNLSVNDKDLFYQVNKAFQDLLNITSSLSLDTIHQYRLSLSYAIERWDMDYDLKQTNDQPNAMQKKALKELKRFRDMGQKKALIIAATGSGKTHLAAFDFALSQSSRLLFIVHRETILKNAMKTFKNIVSKPLSYGFLTGSQKDLDVDCLFATNLTLSRYFELFPKDYFDYIVFDEVHHAKASTYQSIWNYFEPSFTLGLTATPDRMDDPETIYSLFENNVPLDLRLREAIEKDLIVPFHYYGIRNHFVNYSERDTSKIIKDMGQHENVDLIANELEKHRPSDKLKALAFCVNQNHAKMMDDIFSNMGYHTTHLLGHHHTAQRVQAFDALQDEQYPLEIIFTVDILNEGIDIPRVNMVLFLRPTESSIIFLQQLGRGLRKAQGKDHLTVLDFIGNSYKRSIQIIKALISLNRHQIFDKRTLIDLVNNDFEALELKGVEIHIDALSKEEIIHQISVTNFNERKYLEADYQNFKKYLNSEQAPKHIDYHHSDVAPDLVRFMQVKMNGQKNKSYYQFLKEIGEDVPLFDEFEIKVIEFCSNLLPLIRFEEFFILKSLLEEKSIDKQSFKLMIQETHGFYRDDVIEHAMRYLIEKELVYYNQQKYQLNFNPNHDLKDYLMDLFDYGLLDYEERFKDHQDKLKIYENYRSEQFTLATLQDKVYVYQKGTMIKEDGTVYIFANLKKDRNQAEHLKYNDIFIDEKTFGWESETNTTMDKNRGLINSKEAHLFIRKEKVEDGVTLPFTYIGPGTLKDPEVSKNPKKSLHFNIELKYSLPKDLQFEFMLSIQNEENNDD